MLHHKALYYYLAMYNKLQIKTSLKWCITQPKCSV